MCFCIRKTNWLIRFREITGLYTYVVKHTQHINREFGVTYSYMCLYMQSQLGFEMLNQEEGIRLNM